VSLDPEISAARRDIDQTREHLSSTIDELERRLTAPVEAVRQRLDVGQAVQKHPWIALGVALGAGAIVATTGADRRAAAVAAQKARQGGAASLRVAREAPSRGREALGGAVGALGAKLAMTLIESLREPSAPTPTPEPRAGVGFLEHAAPPHEAGETF
jgi:hypothetical protein